MRVSFLDGKANRKPYTATQSANTGTGVAGAITYYLELHTPYIDFYQVPFFC